MLFVHDGVKVSGNAHFLYLVSRMYSNKCQKFNRTPNKHLRSYQRVNVCYSYLSPRPSIGTQNILFLEATPHHVVRIATYQYSRHVSSHRQLTSA